MANVTVSAPLSNITVNSQSNVVTVSSTLSNIVVGETAQTTTATIRAAFSNTSPITYDSVNGIFGIDSTAFTSNIATTGNVSASYYLGNGSLLTGIDELTNAQAQAFIEANGLDATANLTTTANVTGAYLHGDGSNITGLTFTTNAGAKAYIEANGLDATANLESNDHVVGRTVVAGVRANATTVTANGELFAGNTVVGNLAVGLGSTSATERVYVNGNVTTVNGWGKFTDGVETNTSSNVITGNLDLAGRFVDMDGGLTVSQRQGNSYIIFNLNDGVNKPLIEWNNTATQTFTFGYGRTDTDPLNEGGFTWYKTNNTLQANTLESINSIQADGVTAPGGTFTITGEGSITGNLVVGGNLDYTHVNDLYVANNEIIMNSNAATDVNVTITVNRPVAGSNAYLRWDETADEWKFYDGSTEFTYLRDIVEDTTPQLGGNLDINNNQLLLGNAVEANAQFIFGSGYGEATGGRIFGNTDRIQIESGSEANLISRGNMTINFGAGADVGDNFKLVGTGTTDTFIEAIHNGELRLGATSPTAEIILGESGQAPIQFTQEADSNSNITTSANINAAGGTLTGIVTSNSNIQMTDSDAIFIGDLNGAIQQEVRNETGATLSRGKAVYLTGAATGSTPHVALANAEVVAEMPALGVVKNNIANASVGEVVISGQLNIGTHGFTIGSQLFINGAGDLTETIPLGESNLVQKIGKVVTDQQIIVQGAGRTNATPNLDEGNIFLGSSSGTAISVTPDSNFDTTGNAFSLSNTLTDVNSITSESASGMTLKGQTGGIDIDKTIDSTSSRIIDFNTTGYALESADFGSANVTSDNVPSFLVWGYATAGSNTMTMINLFGNGSLWAGKQTGPAVWTSSFVFDTGVDFATAMAAQVADFNDSGWYWFDTNAGDTVTVLPEGAYVTGMSGNTLTFSENFIESVPAGVSGFTGVIYPGAFSSTQNIGFALQGDTSVSTIPYDHAKIRLNKFVLPETLSNVTLDAVSYGDATVDMANVVTKHMADAETGSTGSIRTPRALLIGANATIDALSIGEDDILPAPALLGLTLENDGLTFANEVNTAPQTKFLINQFTENSLNQQTSYPLWTEFLGESGDANVDMKYLGAPQFNFKMVGGDKTTKKPVKSSEVVGRIAWNTVIPGVASGSDVFHPPASIVARAPGDSDAPANLTLANVDLHFQSTYATSYRNGTTSAGGTIPRTFLSSNEGNTVIAAKTDGRIALKPQRDYADLSNSAVFGVENRFAHELHDYHTFLSAEFANTTAKTGTIVHVQPEAGETGTAGTFNYDSKGNATLRLSTHLSNGDVNAQWDLTNEETSGNLLLRDNINSREVLNVGGDSFNLGSVLRLHNLSNTAILALTNNQAGDMVYNSTDNLVAYFDGTDWRNIAQGAIIT